MKKKRLIRSPNLTILLLLISIICGCNKEDSDDKTVKDIDGNVYKIVSIGTQLWMVENLKVTKYSNGDEIGTTNTLTLDISSENSPAYQWNYDGYEPNADTYGRLYTWYAVVDNRGLCPTGWHIPSDLEWATLVDYLGGSEIAGCKLKESGTDHWYSPNAGATNESGFTALPSGARMVTGNFDYLSLATFWWTSTEETPSDAKLRCVNFDVCEVFEIYGDKKNGFSVRCLKN